jgi:hypothetical protein
MKLENGYKVLYATPVKDEATDKVVKFVVSASDTGLFDDAKEILVVAKGSFKLIYEKDGKIYASEKNIPTDNDKALALDEVFVKKAEGTTTEPTEQPEQPKQDEVENTPDEGQDDGQEDEGQDGDEQVVTSEEE